MTLTMNPAGQHYDITIERGALGRADKLFHLDRRVLVVTDGGVPSGYAEAVAALCRTPHIVTVPEGEDSKSLDTLSRLAAELLDRGFTRTDAVVAVGGGVVGDLAGFTAATFMRGIDFYNIPTTLLSQVDSSIGGKTAVNHMAIKNCLGAFHQPMGVIVDPEVLSTLPPRQLSNGLAEAIKMAATFDAELFSRMERLDPREDLDAVIAGSLAIKKAVVEQDPTEKSLRRVLNFGHTLGHGIESCFSLHGLYHGECVALGMLPLTAPHVRPRLRAVLNKVGLPVSLDFDIDRVLSAVAHDKKMDGDCIHYIYLPEIGRYEMKTAPLAQFQAMAKEALTQ